MNLKNKITFIILLIELCSFSAFSQQVKINPFAVKPSTLIEELKTVKNTNPKSVEEFVAAANKLLDEKGLNFTVAFDAATCQKIQQIKNARKDKNALLDLRTAIKSISGEAASLTLPEPLFAGSECFPCYVKLPVLEISDSQFAVKIQDRNVGFFMPSNFSFNEVTLVDAANFSNALRKWKIPSRLKPVSISDDGSLLFLELAEPELRDLILIAYPEGVYQFFARKDLDSEIKSESVKEATANAQVANHSFLKFTKGEKTQIIKFPTNCSAQ